MSSVAMQQRIIRRPPVLPRVKQYIVEGWGKDVDPGGTLLLTRRSLGKMRITATDAQMAQKTYARCKQIPEKAWDDNTDNPPVVIRVG